MNRTLWMILLVSSMGCVPKARYDESLAAQDDLKGRVEGLRSAITTMSSEITRLKGDLSDAQAALSESNRKLAAKMAEANQMKSSMEEMTTALAELERRRAQSERSLQEFRDLVARFQAMIDAGTLRVKILDGRMVVELATDILFPAGSASLSKAGETAILEVAKVLASIEGREFQIAGHTDDRPIHTAQFPSNWHLGAARAIAVTNLLIKGGLPAERVSAASFAELRPVDTNRTKEGRASNRRIEIVLVPDLSTLPGYAELQKAASQR